MVMNIPGAMVDVKDKHWVFFALVPSEWGFETAFHKSTLLDT